MRIGIDARVLMDKYYSGVSEYAFCLIRALLSQDQKNEYVLFYNSARDLRARVERFRQPNVSYRRYRFPNKLFNYGLLKIFKRPRLDKAMGVDVFFAPHINFFALARADKSVLTVHDLSFWRRRQFFSKRQNFWHRALALKKILSSFGYIVAVSQSTKNDIKELAGRQANVKVIYSGIRPHFFHPPAPAAWAAVRQRYNLPAKFILFLGTIEPRKNIGGLIKAYEILRQDFAGFDDYKLVIAGRRGWKAKAVYRLWQNSSLKKDILFLGYVDNEHRPALYRLAALFVFPSFYEGFGLPPLEAAALGTPVIASAVSSLSEVIGAGGLLVNPFNAQEIAQAMAQVLASPALADSLRQKGRQQAKQFSWPAAAGQYLELFQEINNKK